VKVMNNFNNPKAVSDAAIKIYDERYKTEYEKTYRGKFVAINVVDGSATIGETPSEALTKAKEQYPNGFFHLIRVGYTSAFEVGLALRHAHADRIY
jgi:hypothetical protein